MKRKIIKTTLIIVAVLSVIILVRFYMLGQNSKTAKPPGLISGRLSPCPDKPNCVNSEFAEDRSHYISPLSYPAAKSDEIMALIKAVIQEAGGEIQSEQDTYIAATFTVSIFSFVDDFECRQDTLNHIIHVRSASRVGTSDLGVNKKRVELISDLYAKRVSHLRDWRPF